MKRFSLIALFVLLLVSVVGASAQIDCPVPPPCPIEGPCPMVECWFPPTGVFTNPDWLRIDHHRVNVTVADQIAQTNVSMEFVNDGEGLAEGTFLFPLPAGASVDTLIMYINDQPVQAQILEADEARAYYDEIVRQYRDPALLEYVGMGAVQANVFPIPPGETRRIELAYSQVLEVDNGLIHYVYPLDVSLLTSQRPIDDMSISINVMSADEISTVYSPSHQIVVSNNGDNAFSAGFERSNFAADQDFSLYYGIASDEISVNALTYVESADQDGFFMLIAQPPLELPPDQITPRDIILVVDQSGSMQGDKWTQAQDAARYVLENLNADDRFNAILFSTGWRVFSNELESSADAEAAAGWIDGMFAEGGTDINGSLTTALEMVDPEREATILFITDGLPTEGESNPERIMENLTAIAPDNARIFTFGVGDDVDTFLLDGIARAFNGASSYVRPTERIDEEVASLYNKISATVLNDVEITVDGAMIDSVYPELPVDLFAGTQLTLVGRYRDGAENVSVTLSGTVNGEPRSYTYDGFTFRDLAGGEPFIAQLWATRRIGDLLNSIRLDGENPELVNSIVDLSVRYGIITPYTSFLIDENDILSQTGRDAAVQSFAEEAQTLAGESFGGAAVDAADMAANMQVASAPMQLPMTQTPMGTMTAGTGTVTEIGAVDGDFGGYVQQNPIQTVGGKTFLLLDGVWTDTEYQPDTMTTQKVDFLSDAYFDLLTQRPELGEYLALGERVIVVLDDMVLEVVVP